MSVVVRKSYPDYERRATIGCVTFQVTMISRGDGNTTLTATLDEGRASEREVTWVHGEDHPLFVFKGVMGVD